VVNKVILQVKVVEAVVMVKMNPIQKLKIVITLIKDVC
jgi:hypothetical protein